MKGPGEEGRVLVLQHLAVEDPGALGDLLTEAGLALTVVELDEGEPIPPLDPFDLMLVMGGPMDAWQEDQHPWLVDEKSAIRHWVSQLERPYLGVCLGHQLLADALGGSVGPMPSPEVGVVEIHLTPPGRADPVFSQLSPTIRGLQWHGAQVLDLPSDGVVLATNADCAIQAIRIGPAAWGVQFHLEVSGSTVPEWAKVPEYQASIESLEQGDVAWLDQAVTEHLAAMSDAAATLLSGLLSAVWADRERRQATDHDAA
jgi:GMP synthase-like glutamine amidotransferase